MDHVMAPGLLEVAQTRWDVEREPAVTWDRDGRVFWLVDPGSDDRIMLAAFATAVTDPLAVAGALAETLAACDFPPTDDHASETGVAAALSSTGHRAVADTALSPTDHAPGSPRSTPS